MMTRPSSCSGCPLNEGVYAPNVAIGFSSPEGTGSSGVLLLAEALGEKESLDGLPLRPNAPAGSVFQGIIRRLSGVSREQFTISNTIWCRPGPRNWLDGAPYEYGAIEHCQRHNAALIAQRKPRIIVALGAIPMRTATGMAGYHQGIKMVRGFQLWTSRPDYMVDGKPIPVVATYHPSYLMRGSKTRSRDKDGKQDGGTGAKVEKAEGGMSLVGVVTRDIQLAMQIAKTGPLVRPKYEVIRGDREVMDALVREAELNLDRPLAWDIETPRSIDMAADESEIDHVNGNVTQIQFALDSRRGFVFPGFAADWVRDGTRKLLSMRRRMYTWNGWKFDNKVVSGQFGIPILGEDIDLMSAWHWVQPDLPQGLQYATSFYAPELGPWKHFARFTSAAGDQLSANDQKDMDDYGTCDVISLHMNAEGIFKAMDDKGLRTTYDRHVLKLRTEMVAASKRGFPVDAERHEAFGQKIGIKIGEINDAIQLLIPEAILNLEPKRKPKGSNIPEYGYVNTPKQILPWLDDQGNPKDGGDRVTIREEVPVDDGDGGSEDGESTDVHKGTENYSPKTEVRTVVYVRRSVSVFNGKTLENESVLRWCRLKPFSVGSPQQKIRYIEFKREEEIAGRMGKGQPREKAERLALYKVPKVRNKQKDLKDNTGAKEIEKLFKGTGDPVFGHFVEIGKLKKMYGTYYKGWLKHGAAKGFVHTTFGLADTGTGQLSSVDPNIQNAPKHSDLAKEFRAAIRAKEGHVLVEIDKKSFHAQTLAFEARDLAYARLSAIDVHSFMTAFRLKFKEAKDLMSWSDKDMIGWFKEQKKSPILYKSEAVPNYPDGLTFQQVRDYKSKRVILGIGFCQGAQSILEQNPESYKDKKEVQTFLDLFGDIFGEVKKFQTSITQLAHKQTHLISRWGYIRRFYDVFQWSPNKWNQFSGSAGDWTHGDDFEAAVAFLPANHAFGMFKEEMLRLAGYRIPGDHPDYPSYLSGKLIWPTKTAEDLLEKYNFINQIHDSLIFHPYVSQVDQLLEDVMGIMREPCPTLYWEGQETKGIPAWTKDGLFVDAEAMMGPDWASMKGVNV